MSSPMLIATAILTTIYIFIGVTFYKEGGTYAPIILGWFPVMIAMYIIRKQVVSRIMNKYSWCLNLCR